MDKQFNYCHLNTHNAGNKLCYLCGQYRSRSDCIDVQSDLDLQCLLPCYRLWLKRPEKYNILAETFNISINPFPNKPWFFRICSTKLLRTLWKKEKLLITRNFSFSDSVFYPSGKLSGIFIKFEIFVCKLFQIGRVLNLSLGKVGLSTVSVKCVEPN